MVIVFTGHRDCVTEAYYLEALLNHFQGAKWMHGGAIGFDTQVKLFARGHHFEAAQVRPDYNKYPAKYAPIARNHAMVDQADMLDACWDGRKTGGTYDTIEYAKKKGVRVEYAPCNQLEPEPQPA